jgi:AbrB family looped-hinge helix DNA binding protein
MTEVAVKLGAGGRLVIPGELRAALGIEPGNTLILVLEDDGLRLLTPRQAVARAQAIVGRCVPASVSLVDELIRERHEEGRNA